ncbi:MAG: nucleoside transporter C-terminal domain-containing protein [Parvibaculum sp.]|uniref:NupC/NupG family nucleoside CNT transporter n=1 Tax=Parvibaculum sp. TaxID=2024848 RepID=UPI00271CC8E7|nr:nucleoside transporter C-terminal domain-containing protein [Parvibaculum sp.]MDO8838392.1 nucleoside transporter C-terminal domain-containing protein [Parvibaculum sp.]
MPLLSLQSALGLAAIVGLAWVLSENRRAARGSLLKDAAVAIALQLALALALLKVALARDAMLGLNSVVEALMAATGAGTGFVFGYLGGGDAPYDIAHPQNSFVLAFQALPLVLFMSALSALLWYWRILPVITRGFAFLLRKSMGIGGAVGLSSAANVFVGMVEAPLLIKPYLEKLSRSELFAVMTVGLATVAGTVLFLYAGIIASVVPGSLGQIITASLISLPAALLIARLMVPEAHGRIPTGVGDDVPVVEYENSMDALTRGTLDGLSLLLNIIAMLIVMVALVALLNILLALLPEIQGAPLSLQRIFGWVFAPLVWLMGVPASEAAAAGQIMGTKTILNELLAYIALAGEAGAGLSDRSRLIMVYALCGFANPASVGIMIGGLAAIVPSRRSEIVELAPRALISGTLATSMTGAVIGLIT